MVAQRRFALLSALVGVNVLGIFLVIHVVHKKEIRLFTFSVNLSDIFFNTSTTYEINEDQSDYLNKSNEISNISLEIKNSSSTNSEVNFEPNDYKYKSYDIYSSPTFNLAALDHKTYFRKLIKVTCFISGTNWQSTQNDALRCDCLGGWFGADCGIPEVVWLSLPKETSLTRRDNPRRVIHGLNVNHELDLFEVRVNELGDAIDVYLVCESNYTAYGRSKPLYFLDKFKKGFLREFQDKIVYVYQDVFPVGGREDGWIADGYQRTFLTQRGLKQIIGVHEDDLFLLNDADEIPKKEVILFLKLYDGYPEPIRISLRWTVYGFFWHVPDKHTEVCSVCSLKMFHNAMADDGKLLRGQKIHPSLKKSFKSAGGVFNPWVIRGEGGEAGWHCSWCVSPEGIKWKLNSAQNGDFPRWGDYPEKQNLGYIKSLIASGTWFNDEDRFESQNALLYIPDYVLANRDKFKDILVNNYAVFNKKSVPKVKDNVN